LKITSKKLREITSPSSIYPSRKAIMSPLNTYSLLNLAGHFQLMNKSKEKVFT
jgi:hypothetical protein